MITPETKTFSISAGIVCAVALVVLGGMLYLIERKDGLYEHEQSRRATHAAIEREFASQTALLAETAADRKELARSMLTEDTVVDFLSLVGTLARAQGVVAETRSLAVESIEGNETFEYLTLTMDVTGAFSPVMETLVLLESLPYQINIRTTTVERADAQTGDGLWQGRYRLYVTKYK